MKTSLRNVYPTADPSEFIHRITFLEQVTTSDASGAVVSYGAGSPPDVTWAKIEILRGTDVIRSGQDTSKVFATITSHYRPGRGQNTRIQSPSGSVFIVRAVENVREMNMFSVFTCIGLGANE